MLSRLLRLVAAVAGGVLLLWVAGAKLADLLLPFGTDQGLYSLVGASILRGELPYRDVWDNKPPGVYYSYAAALAWFPPHSVDCTLLPVTTKQVGLSCGHIGVIALDLLFSAGAAVALFAAGRHILGSPRNGVLAAALFLLFAVQAPLSHGGAKPELLLLLPEVLGYVLLWCYLERNQARWLALAGAFIGLAMLSKQSAVTAAAGALVVLAARVVAGPRRITIGRFLLEGVWLSTGLLITMLPVVALFWSRAALPDIMYGVVGFNLEYARGTPGTVAVGAVTGSWRVFRDGQALLWLLALVGWWRLLHAARRRQAAWLLCTWTLGDIAALALGGDRFYSYYYLQIVPSFSLLAAYAVSELWHGMGTHRRGGRLIGLAPSRVWLVVSFATVFVLAGTAQAQVLLRTLHERVLHFVPSEEERVSWVIRHAPPGPLLVWGDANQVYALVGRAPASKYAHAVAVSARWTRSSEIEDRREELLADLERTKPALIAIDPWTDREDPTGERLLNATSFPQLRELLHTRYADATLDAGPFGLGSFGLYVRKS